MPLGEYKLDLHTIYTQNMGATVTRNPLKYLSSLFLVSHYRNSFLKFS